jgi:hypothetical protein
LVLIIFFSLPINQPKNRQNEISTGKTHNYLILYGTRTGSLRINEGHSRAGIAVGNTPQDLKFCGVFFYYEEWYNQQIIE